MMVMYLPEGLRRLYSSASRLEKPASRPYVERNTRTRRLGKRNRRRYQLVKRIGTVVLEPICAKRVGKDYVRAGLCGYSLSST